MRQYEYEVTDYCYVFVAEHITESRIFISNRGGASMFPLYLYPDEAGLLACEQRRPNFSATFITYLEQRLGLTFVSDGAGNLDTTMGPEDVFHYMYAVLHSPTYRSRYAELLKIDFPRIPITSDISLFKTLVGYGAMLVDLHLLRLPGSGGVCGAGGAALLCNPTAQGVTQQGVTQGPVEQVTYHEQDQRVVIGTGRYFAGVEPTTWTRQIGGYYPLHKWLKDRKGRTLSFDDALHYMQMVIALREMRRVMGEIDQWYKLN